jgi:hypothetical protein
MTELDRADPLLQALAALPVVSPEAAHADRVRQRCRATLERTPVEPLAVLEPAVLSVTCATYAWQLAKAALLLSR